MAQMYLDRIRMLVQLKCPRFQLKSEMQKVEDFKNAILIDYILNQHRLY